MTKVKLSDVHTRKKAPPGKTLEYYDTVQTGLTLRIGPRGGSYIVVFQVKGEPQEGDPKGGQWRRKIGTTSTVPDLETARALAKAMIRDAANGIRPEERAAEEAAKAKAQKDAARRADAQTFKTIADEYLADQDHLHSWGELDRKLRKDLPDWHDRPIRSIERAEIRQLIQRKAGRKLGHRSYEHGPASNRLLSFVKRLFAWELERDEPRIDVDPSRGVKPLHDEKPRVRLLSTEEIWWFWRGCDRLGDPAGRLFQLCLATGQRRGEVAGMKRSEIGRLEYEVTDDAGAAIARQAPAWLLPAERTKRKVAHSLPLSTLALELIEGAPKLKGPDGEEFEEQPDHVMPSGRRGDQPVSGFSRYKLALDKAIGEVRAEELGEPYDPEKHDLAPWHVHDLRRTAASHMRRPPLKIPKATISYILNHAEGDGEGRSMTVSVYLEGPHAEAVDAMERWGEHLRKIVAPKPEAAGAKREAA